MRLNRSLPALVVDDFSSVCSVVARVLTTMGFQTVDSAQTGEDALALAQSRRYGLVVSDLHMKPVSGVDFLYRMKADPRMTSIPVIILTGDPLLSAAKSAKAAGAIAVVDKVTQSW